MSVGVGDGTAMMAAFVASGPIGPQARERAAAAFADTIGVMLAGARESAARMAQAMAAEEGTGPCGVPGTAIRTGPQLAAFANGVAAHALDYDDMCFVSLAHPSCVLVPAALAAGELTSARASLLLDAYVAGFEIECRLGAVMNPRHYHQRGWHCTSSIGTLGAAAAAARVLGLDAARARHALGIAASAACGVKENLGTMVKPLHAGLAARNGVMAAQLAQRGFTASLQALDGPQGYLAAMDSEHRSLDPATADLGTRWEILETGVTVKLYPSCAATHPPLDALIDLQRREGFTPADIDAIDVEVDSMTPRLLIHPSPADGLAAKFSMPFCAAAALVYGPPDLATFDLTHIRNPAVQALMPRVTLRANPAFDAAAPLSQARVTVRLRDGRQFVEVSDGARGYPGRLTDGELSSKFAACASGTLTAAGAAAAWAALQDLGRMTDVRDLTATVATTA
ncbi:MAG TPA: MmgE/PrpD family protein [Vicinamibacterales bacterium]|jgi:2-methylcitrate dehydratase PrpD|nr:MmgE/PrpD family protein [Vicinamibacterales bacterium]